MAEFWYNFLSGGAPLGSYQDYPTDDEDDPYLNEVDPELQRKRDRVDRFLPAGESQGCARLLLPRSLLRTPARAHL